MKGKKDLQCSEEIIWGERLSAIIPNNWKGLRSIEG